MNNRKHVNRNEISTHMLAIQNFYKVYLSVVKQSPFTLGLRVKGDRLKQAHFHSEQKGVRDMKTIFFSDHNREKSV